MVKEHMAMNRFLKWFFDVVACGSTPMLSTDQVDKLKKTMCSHHDIWCNFATPGKEGFDDSLKEKMDAWLSAEFSGSARVVSAADLVYRTLKGDFLDDFRYLASKAQLTLDDFLRNNSEHEIDNLRIAFKEFVDKCSETACGVVTAPTDDPDAETIPGDVDSELRAACKKKALKLRRDRAQFHSLGVWMNTESTYRSGGKMSTILQNSRVGRFVGEPGKNNSLFLLSAELLPTEGQFGKAEAYKTLQVSEKELSKPLEWMQKAKGPATIIVALDGRVRKLRRALEDWAENANKDPQRLIQGPPLGQPVAPHPPIPSPG